MRIVSRGNRYKSEMCCPITVPMQFPLFLLMSVKVAAFFSFMFVDLRFSFFTYVRHETNGSFFSGKTRYRCGNEK